MGASLCVWTYVHWQPNDCIIHPTNHTPVSILSEQPKFSFLFYSLWLYSLYSPVLFSFRVLLCPLLDFSKTTSVFLKMWTLSLFIFPLKTVHKRHWKRIFGCMNMYCEVVISRQETWPECFVGPCHMTRETQPNKDPLTSPKVDPSSYQVVLWDERVYRC